MAEPHPSVRLLLDQHINDVIGAKERPWEFPGSGSWAENIHELGFDATADPPDAEDNAIDSDGYEFEASEIPLPPLYKLKVGKDRESNLEIKSSYLIFTDRFLTFTGENTLLPASQRCSQLFKCW